MPAGDHTIELEDRGRILDIHAEAEKKTIQQQLQRLRDLSRTCVETRDEVKELAAISASLEKDPMLIRTGRILTKAAKILAPAVPTLPDLPKDCYPPLKAVRDSLVKVILSWSTEKSARQQNNQLHAEMLDAIVELEGAVDKFVSVAHAGETVVLRSIILDMPELRQVANTQ